MNLQYKHILIVFLCCFLLSCSTEDDECSIKEQNKFVHELLLDRYLWYKDIDPELSQLYTDFDSPEQVLDLVKVEQDRFSYITTVNEFNSLFNDGQIIKYGFSAIVEADNTVRIRFVFDDSAAGRAAIERGDEILSINNQIVGNQTVAQIISSTGWSSSLFGPDEVGYPLDLQLRKKNGDTFTVELEKSVVNINTVLHHSIIKNGSDLVAYLVFNSFLTTSNAELFAVFSEFKAAGVNKMILDLRYNGGGSVGVAQYLASGMLVTDSSTDLFTVLRHNDKYQDLNRNYFFNTLENELDLEQVTVITTGETASASEMVINGLKPFYPEKIKTVGSQTFGKPVGMNPFEFCDKMVLPITFAGYNRDGQGDFFNGIAADCAAEDDAGFSFGDIHDPMLSEALFVSLNNTCSEYSPTLRLKNIRLPAASYSLQDVIGVY